MNRAIESLVQDHWFLRRALNALECFARECSSTGTVDRKDLTRFAEFLRFYGDVHHAAKEEDVLFPFLSTSGVGRWEAGPLAEARRDQGQERYLMRVLEQYASRDGDFSPERLRELTSEVEALLHSMRHHFAFEEEHIFPLVGQLTQPQQLELAERLRRFDASSPSAEQCGPMRETLSELAARYSC